MEKYWIVDNKQNRLIFIKEESIYFGTPKEVNNSKFLFHLKKGIVAENIFGIPYAYIKRIECQSKSQTIKIYFGKDSEDEIYIKNDLVKNEIFDYLKYQLSKFEYSERVPSIFKHTKPQLFSILFSILAFLLTFNIAEEIENGAKFQLEGRTGIGSILLGISQFGRLKVIIGFSLLISIAAFSFVQKNKKRGLTKYLIREKSKK